MKKSTMLLMVAGGLLVQSAVAGPTDIPAANNNPSAMYKAPEKKIQSVYQVLQPKHLFISKTPAHDQIDRVGGISSRPWGQIAGSPAPASFFDQRVYEPHGNLFWVGATPN